ncbi:Uncharacterized protein DBV15_00601 [Temnothorax longispinosus]|uniref:Uncharacterized protein n=1 Tax=Temnothorax longispinosus TaxID=300112 RepID=A0A4S2KXZ6_9HYME|nr:Uncharacterized protein DBV15_00601 [Temnothorax longispinosus]
MAGGRLGGRQGGGPLGHLIGRQSFLIGSQEIYRNEPRWRIVMTWPRAHMDLEVWCNLGNRFAGGAVSRFRTLPRGSPREMYLG